LISYDHRWIEQQVTLFTASDSAGRSLLTAMARITAGAAITSSRRRVAGQNIYGEYPVVGFKPGHDVGAGRLIPTTAVEQYGEHWEDGWAIG